jgi:hypothetical protein
VAPDHRHDRLQRALERIVTQAAALGDLAGVTTLAEIAYRALAGEDIAPEPAADPAAAYTVRRVQWPGPSYVLAAFLVTEDGERHHPMDVSVVKLNVDATGLPDEDSMKDLTQRVTRAVQRKVAERRA